MIKSSDYKEITEGRKQMKFNEMVNIQENFLLQWPDGTGR